MQDKVIELQSGVIGTFVFLLLKLCYKIQVSLSSVFCFIFLKPALWIAKIINADKKFSKKVQEETDQPTPFTVLDTHIFWHRILLKYLKGVFKINSILSGVVFDKKVYDKLLIWNKKIPVIGFRSDKTTFTIQLLLNKGEKGRAIDIIWLTAHKIKGNFRILSCYGGEDKNGTVMVRSIWISGDDVGKIFNIGRNFPFDETVITKVHTLSGMYYPPKVIILLFELLISASALLAFVQLAKYVWEMIKPFLAQ